MATYKFDQSFQRKLLRLLAAGIVPSSLVKPDYFQNPILAELCSSILSLRESSHGAITGDMAYNKAVTAALFRDKEYRSELRRLVRQISGLKFHAAEQRFIIDEASKFARLQNYRQAIMEADGLLEEPSVDTLDRLDALFEKNLSSRPSGNDDSLFYFSSLADRIKKLRAGQDVLLSLIGPIDKMLDGGGFSRQEINLVVGLPSAGKTFWLLHMAKAAVIQKKRVLFFSLEMTNSKLATRLDASFLGIKTTELSENIKLLDQTLRKYKRLFGDNLVLQKMPAGQTTVHDLDSSIRNWQTRGFSPDVILLDYINLMAPPQRSREGRHRDLGQTYMDLKGLSQRYNQWLFTAAQSNRSGAEVKVITMSNLADSFEGSMHADVVMSLNRNDQEAKYERIRIFFAKNKNNVDKQTIQGFTDYSRGSFWKGVTNGLKSPGGTENGESQGSGLESKIGSRNARKKKQKVRQTQER